MLRLHTAINPADFVFWWMWFNGSHTQISTASFSDECIFLPLYVYNILQDGKSARLIAMCKRTLITVILLIMYGSIPAVTISPGLPPGNVTQQSPRVGNCVDYLVPRVDAGNTNTRYARGLVPSLQARRAVWQDGVRNFAENTQGLILTTSGPYLRWGRGSMVPLKLAKK